MTRRNTLYRICSIVLFLLVAACAPSVAQSAPSGDYDVPTVEERQPPTLFVVNDGTERVTVTVGGHLIGSVGIGQSRCFVLPAVAYQRESLEVRIGNVTRTISTPNLRFNESRGWKLHLSRTEVTSDNIFFLSSACR